MSSSLVFGVKFWMYHTVFDVSNALRIPPIVSAVSYERGPGFYGVNQVMTGQTRAGCNQPVRTNTRCITMRLKKQYIRKKLSSTFQVSGKRIGRTWVGS